MWGATSLSWGYCTSQRPPGRGHRGHGRPWSSPPATQGHSEAAPYTRLPVGRRQGPGLGSGDGKAQAAAPTRGQGQVSRKAAAAASTSWFRGRGQSPGKGQPVCGRRAGRTLQKRPRPRAGGASQVLPKARESWPGGPAPPAPPARPRPQWLSGAERLLSASLGGSRHRESGVPAGPGSAGAAVTGRRPLLSPRPPSPSPKTGETPGAGLGAPSLQGGYTASRWQQCLGPCTRRGNTGAHAVRHCPFSRRAATPLTLSPSYGGFVAEATVRRTPRQAGVRERPSALSRGWPAHGVRASSLSPLEGCRPPRWGRTRQEEGRLCSKRGDI